MHAVGQAAIDDAVAEEGVFVDRHGWQVVSCGFKVQGSRFQVPGFVLGKLVSLIEKSKELNAYIVNRRDGVNLPCGIA